MLILPKHEFEIGRCNFLSNSMNRLGLQNPIIKHRIGLPLTQNVWSGAMIPNECVYVLVKLTWWWRCPSWWAWPLVLTCVDGGIRPTSFLDRYTLMSLYTTLIGLIGIHYNINPKIASLNITVSLIIRITKFPPFSMYFKWYLIQARRSP